MKLKRLQLQGYKTFASKTEFDFDSGITAIVGPNGSGKSNIADAVRWVLGEQSYSTLRGKRTTDMIFAGSQSRARAGMAQATLTLDNSDGWLPIDYTEVEISRRAFRSGENEYLINGQKMRLRDVQDLLATSGLAERTYTIIGQGLIDQALSLRAEERRALFEEAAGVSHYQARRAETLRRLQETQRNLERVHDILSEIRPRLGALKRQANRARNYEQVETDLRQLLRMWYGYQWDRKREVLRQQRQAAAEAETSWKAERKRMAEQQDEIDRMRRSISQLQDEISHDRTAREELREQREGIQRQVAVLSERRASLQRQVDDIKADLPRLEEQRNHAQEELATATNDLDKAQVQLREQQEELKQFNQSFEATQAEIDRWNSTIQDLEQAQRNSSRKLSQAEGQLTQLRERLQEREKQADSTGNGSLQVASEQVTVLEQRVSEAQQRVDDLQEQRQAVHRQQSEARKKVKALQQEQRELDRQHNQLVNELARLEARRDLLDQMRQREVQVSDDVSILGRLASFVTIPAEYQTALEAALGARLNTLILPDRDSLWRLLKANGAKDRLLAVASSDVRATPPGELPDHPDVLGWAYDLIKVKAGAKPLAELLFGPVLLVSSREAAYTVARELPPHALAAAPDGFIAYAGGLVDVRPADPQHSVLAHEEAFRVAQQQVKEKKQSVRNSEAGQEKKRSELEKAQAVLDRLSGEEQKLNRSLNEASQHLSKQQRELDRAQQKREFLHQQQQAHIQELERLRTRITSVQGIIEEEQEQIVRLESRTHEARIRLQELPVAEAKQQRQAQKQEIESARTIVAGRQAVVESRRATFQQIEGQLRRQQERLERLSREQRQLDIDVSEEKLRQLQKKIGQIDEALQPKTARLKELQQSLRQLEERLIASQRKAHDLETNYTQMTVALSQRENQLEGLEERIRADLGLVALEFDEEHGGQDPLPFSEVVDHLPKVDELPEGIEKNIQEARAQLHRIGSVNPDAPVEYEETQERYDFLTQQVEDLNHTEKRLRAVIAELDDLTSRAFADTVNEVNGIFGEMFERLFGGGSAHLALTEPDDLTISGVEIVCRLPNRRQQRLGLLSGGARSLTAAALIFALLKVAPPPFCILDEVDAMLDEANVTRFRTVLYDLAENSQFIIITHNRGTVQAAQTVYGISMGADSASQVLSIKPEEYVNGGD